MLVLRTGVRPSASIHTPRLIVAMILKSVLPNLSHSRITVRDTGKAPPLRKRYAGEKNQTFPKDRNGDLIHKCEPENLPFVPSSVLSNFHNMV